MYLSGRITVDKDEIMSPRSPQVVHSHVNTHTYTQYISVNINI